MRRMLLSFAAAGGLFALLIVYSAPARAGAYQGLWLWGEMLVPSLLPFFAAAGLLARLGLTEVLGRWLSPALGRWLCLSPAGVGVFVLGLTAGYPLGAAAAAEALETGRIGKNEAERLLRFSDNTGPAFAVGALGLGIFGSGAAGLFLWGVHALSALLLGIRCGRGRRIPAGGDANTGPAPMSFAAALTDSVAGAVRALLSIGGYVVFFSALLGVSGAMGFPERAAEWLARGTGADAAVCSALLTGALELSAGIGAMRGMPLSPASLALGSFLLGWGGLCVHFQSMAVAAPAGLDMKGRRRGKLLHGVLSAAITWIIARIVF